MQIDTEVNIDMCAYNVHAYAFFVCPLRGPRGSDIPGASKPSICILVSKYHSPLKGTRVPWISDWFQDWDREKQDEPGASCGATQK